MVLVAALSLVFASLQALTEYRRDSNSLRKTAELIQVTQLEPLTAALWSLDRQQLAAQLEGIRHYPHIAYVAVLKQDRVVVEAGHRLKSHAREWQVPLSFDFNGRLVPVGALYFQADTLPILRQVFVSVASALFFQTATVLLVTLFVFMLFGRHVIRHLTASAAYFATFTPGDLGTPLRLSRKAYHDEIDTLVETFNAMRESLAASYQEQQRSLQQLQQTSDQYRALAELTYGISWEFDLEHDRWIYVAPQAERILGYGPEEWTDYGWWLERLHPEDREWVPLFCRDMSGRGKEHTFEYRFLARDGRTVWVMNVVSVEMRHGMPVLLRGIMLDITERKQLEEQLRHSQKMEAIGRLAGGVAHDFNNILTVIMGYSNLLALDTALNERQREQVAQIIASSERASHLTHGLLAFSRRQIMNLVRTDLNGLVLQVQQMLSRIIGEDIQLQVRCCEAPLFAQLDRGQFEQVLMNLATNARDAMEQGGVLSIDTTVERIDPASFPEGALGIAGDYGIITISDTGCGMDSETSARIFEPFFTTKEVGRGTGLGMSIVHGIIRQHNGFITVSSQKGHGSTFRIYLPLAGEAEHAPDQPPRPLLPPGGTETILLAEDDGAVRLLVQQILSQFGYEVLVAEDGQQAVELYRQHRQRIGLVIMDVVMPVMSGPQACREIRQLQPDARVLFSSGYTMDSIRSRGDLEEGVELIMKPVQPLELLGKVREMLDRSAATET